MNDEVLAIIDSIEQQFKQLKTMLKGGPNQQQEQGGQPNMQDIPIELLAGPEPKK